MSFYTAVATLRLAAVLSICLTPVQSVAAETADDFSCSGAELETALVKDIGERLCLADNIKLGDLVTDMVVDGGGITLADIRTVEIAEKPVRRICAAKLTFNLAFHANALGPGPVVLHLKMAGSAKEVFYEVGRFDDGRLYARSMSPPTRPGAIPADPECWKVETLEPVPQ
jgi:hypothetical protein